MIAQVLLLFLINTEYSLGDSCKFGGEKSPYQKLKDDLLCNYDSTMRPVKEVNNQTKVNFGLFPTYVDIEDNENSITLHSWISVNWNDEYLQWKPEEYNNIKYLHISGELIWTPDLSDYNRYSSGDDLSFESHSVIVTYTGKVYLVGLTEFRANCNLDIRNWPNDKHTCGSIIGSRIYFGQHLDLVISNKSLNLSYYVGSKNWKLQRATLVRKIVTFKSNETAFQVTLECNFTLQRFTNTLLPALTFPILGMILMNTIIYWMDPFDLQRSILIHSSIWAHFMILQYLSWMIPTYGETPVLILNFLENSMAMSIVALLVLIFERNIVSTKPVPIWVDKVRLKINSINSLSFLLFPREYKSNESTDQESILNPVTNLRDDWLLILTIFDRIVFYIMFLTYITLGIITIFG